MATPTVTQKAGIEGNFEFQSVSGAAALPSTVHWRLTCDHTGRVLQDYTAAAPVPEYTGGTVSKVSVTVEVPGSVNTLCDSQNQRELHLLTLVADMDTDREYSEDFPFYVKRGGR